MIESLAAAARFHQQLRDTGAYRTDPATPRSTAGRLLGRFDTWFYLRLAGLLVEGHRVARRGDYDAPFWAAHSLSFLRLVEACGGIVDITGLDRVARLGRPSVIVANHMSMLEVLVLPAILTAVDRFAAVAKASLLEHRVVGTTVRSVGLIAVERRDPRADLRSVLEQGTRALGEGRSVLIFPQATRSAVFDPATFNSLGAKLARSAGAPLTPLALRTDFQRNGWPWKDLGRLDRRRVVYFRFGTPQVVSGTGREENAAAAGFIAGALAEWEATPG